MEQKVLTLKKADKSRDPFRFGPVYLQGGAYRL